MGNKKTTRHHLSVNIEGFLRNYSRKKINVMNDDNGKRLTDKEAHAEIAKLQALGHKLIPTCDCKGFDPFSKGCPGHKSTGLFDRDGNEIYDGDNLKLTYETVTLTGFAKFSEESQEW